MADINGTAAGETLIGTSEPDTIRGFGGNDRLFGGAGADFMDGGEGDDIYYVDNAFDQVIAAAGEGSDLVYTTVSYALAAGAEIEILSTISHAATTAIDLYGNEYNNILFGNAGINLLFGGAGADVMYGFGGNDVYFVDNAGDLVIENAGGGSDTVYVSTSFALAAGSEVETLSTVSHGATDAIGLYGNEYGNTIFGNAGANVLFGGGGADALYGLGGDDVYYVDHGGDLVVENAGGGTDTVYASTSFALAAGSEVEVLSTFSHGATDAINLYGNELNNLIFGNAGANVLFGGGGADALYGFGGNDVYYVDNGGDLVVESAGGGNDTVYASASFALAAGSEVETLSTAAHGATDAINLYGNELANTLLGNAGANLLFGGGGADALFGFGGDDVYYVDNAGDAVIEGPGGGTDTVYATISYTLAAGAEVEILSTAAHGATDAISLSGNEVANLIFGNAGANTLNGGAGADTLYGFGGGDSFAFTTTLGGGNIDTIADFTVGVDKILLGGEAGQPFAALASGALLGASFVTGSAATTASQVIIYNRDTGALLYDADGNGAGTAVQIATLSSGLLLSAADFLVSGPANNNPVITSGTTASVAENSPASTIVYQTTATDADGDRITYSLVGQHASLLTIDANGAVRLITPANFEAQSVYNFAVIASDSGSTTGTVTVTLTITDVPEGGPSTPIINEAQGLNDTTQTAQAIDRNILIVADNANLPDDNLPSATIQGSIATTGDLDFFSVTLQAGELLMLDVDGTTNSLDSLLRVYGPNGLEILDNDDQVEFDPGSNPPFGHNTDSFLRFRAPSSGTYYFSVESFEGGSSGSYQLHVSIGPPATPAQIMDEDVDALVSGAEWNHTDLSYGFPTSADQYPVSFTEPDDGFGAFTGVQQAATRSLLQLVANVSSLTFQELTANPGQANLRYAISSEPDVAYAYYPTNGGPNSLGGSAWFNNGPMGTRFANPQQGNYAWMGILHETGHAIGLKHGHEAPPISFDHDSVEYTVMTYRSFPGGGITGGYSNETFGYPQTLMMLDIAALQQIYGANFAYNATDSVYSWNSGTGAMTINGSPATAPGGNRVFLTVWDGGGNDTYDMGNYGTNLTVDLRPGEWSSLGGQLANLGQGHFARGNIANALLYQGNGASLIENGVGGSGNDTMIANQAANQLTGGGGGDTFKWAVGTDAGTGVLADTVLDFVNGSDRIDLSAIDANAETPGDDAFSFIGTGAFTNTAGQVRYDVQGGNAHIFADLDGNGVADMQIILNNVTVLAGTDFIL